MENNIPYYAQITISIDIFPLEIDNSILPSKKLTSEDLKTLGIGNLAKISLIEPTLELCIKKLKEKLEDLTK